MPPRADVLTELPVPCVSSQKSVRLVVNYLRTQKAVVRVSPEVPLHSLLPVICAKCDVSPEHVVLLRDNVAGEELELSKSLSELGLKELYAWDNKRGEARGTRGSTWEHGTRGDTLEQGPHSDAQLDAPRHWLDGCVHFRATGTLSEPERAGRRQTQLALAPWGSVVLPESPITLLYELP